MRRLDLRLRITVAISVVCLGIIFSLGVMLYMASERMEFALVEQLVEEELDFLIERYESNPGYLPETAHNVQYYAVPYQDRQTLLPSYLRELEAGHYEIDVGGEQGERDAVVRQVNNLLFAVVYDIGPYEEREREFRQTVLIALVFVLILTLILGHFLSGFLTHQLTLLAHRVSTIVPDQPYESLLRDEQDREVAMLAKALDKYHDLFLSMIKREQEFTANVSHELRTPLTAIRTSIELLAEDPNLSDKSRKRIHYINHAVNSMTDHTQALLFLAREEEFSEQEQIALLECVEDISSHFHDEIKRKGLAFDIDIHPETMVNANRQAIHLVLTNLIKNAVMYTENGFVRVTHEKSELAVSDSGPGIAAELIPKIFDRNYRGVNKSGGFGLGLDIVKRVCHKFHWDIDVVSSPGQGAHFVIRLNKV